MNSRANSLIHPCKQMLLLELQHSADVLAQGLLDRNSATYASFFSSSVPTEYLTVSSSSDQAFKRAPKLASAKMPMSDGRTGTRILPVYIFSLDHMDHELTLEDFTKVQAYVYRGCERAREPHPR